MGINKLQNIARLHLFELVERTSRFYVHLDEIRDQFYFAEGSRIDDKRIFLHSYKKCLLKITEISIEISKKITNGRPTEKQLNNCLSCINNLFSSLSKLHAELKHLPRPSEPIELRRFSRIIDKHVINFQKITDNISNNNHIQISIYVSEEMGDAAYVEDPLLLYKDQKLNNTIEACNDLLKKKIEKMQTPSEIGDRFHITIPRIDANNPCRWPILIHELGHHLMKETFFKTGEIEKDFETFLIQEQKEALVEIKKTNSINIKSWLTECWCDLFACVLFGPAFWFAQYSSLIAEINNTDYIGYPPPLFRLNLIYNILNHRFEKTLFKDLKKAIHDSELVIEHLDSVNANGFIKNNDFKELYIYFREFFRVKFGKDELNGNLKNFIKYTEEIHEDTIKEFFNQLKELLPIPSKKVYKSNVTQRPSFVQEILLTAWLFRNKDLKEDILRALSGINMPDLEKEYEEKILKIFRRFDQSILRSIQVSEWFDMLFDTDFVQADLELEKELNKKFEIKHAPYIQLNDREIYRLIKNFELKIIPIINLKEQLGATSLDIRLGTSFQLFYQNKYGIVDFSDSKSFHNAEQHSNLIDLDFMECITISPGQFVLAHTMEYIKLPETISAEIEGRSSFARLGIEIHMTAGYIDPGFEGVVTLEIYNAGSSSVKLYPGIRIGQLKFISINDPLKPYNKKNNAKYKTMLAHNSSMQFKDYEIRKIKEEKERREKEKSV